MNAKQLAALGIPPGELCGLAVHLVRHARTQGGLTAEQIDELLPRLVRDPGAHLEDPHFGSLARKLLALRPAQAAERPPEAEAWERPPAFAERPQAAGWAQWGSDLDENAVEQMRRAVRLPVSVRGALMPDAHVGYGLPIGGVLATAGAVIPYAVGVDIACRMRLTVFDLGEEALDEDEDRLARILERETRFGIGAEHRTPKQHEVLDRDWSVSPVTERLFAKARAQLGTSGSGNHFVEWGVFSTEHPEAGLPAGRYLAVLSHSGSRGTGAAVADHYSKLAMAAHPELPADLRHLAWLDLASAEGREYWAAMSLMGHYAAANHAVIHREIARALGVPAILEVENHHNFAWKEIHDGREVVVHRKGATPAGAGVLGIIPGSMASPGYLVRGKGSAEAMDSAAHGAGRVMSRKEAYRRFDWKQVRPLLQERRVKLLSAGLDEVPGVYKDIGRVMEAQRDLVEILGRFDPRIVKMAPAGERAED